MLQTCTSKITCPFLFQLKYLESRGGEKKQTQHLESRINKATHTGRRSILCKQARSANRLPALVPNKICIKLVP